MTSNDDNSSADSPADSSMDSALEAAYDALEAGRPDEALVEAARSEDPVGRALLECRAQITLGHLQAAAGALGRIAEALGDDDLDVLELTGEIALSAWDLDTAQSAFAAVLESEPDEPWILERLGLLADLRGDFAAGDEFVDRASALGDPPAPPVRVSEEAFDAAVESALGALAPTFRDRVKHARVVREPVPFRSLVEPEDPAATPPDILGLFAGASELDAPADSDLPPTIYLFKRNIERASGSPEQVAEEIRITLFHEIGHLLGLNEDEVAAMGLA